MNTPVLTATQKRQSLSHKKKGSKVTIKNILATPYSNYWPLIKEEDAVELKEVLSTHLVCLKAPKVSVPYKDIAGLSKEQRAKVRNEYIKAHCTIQPCKEPTALDAIKFGINNSTRLLEENQASSVLITSEVNPQLMVKHVIELAVRRQTPVLVVPQLKGLLREKTGIASTVVTFKTGVNESKYASIDERIKQIATNYPVPSNHISLPSSLPEKEIADTVKQKLAFDKISEAEEESRSRKDFYLYRELPNERVFKPQLSKIHTSSDLGQLDVDFISFSPSKTPEVELQSYKVKTVKVSYKSLLVKRVVNNPNRDKQKIAALKRKKGNK